MQLVKHLIACTCDVIDGSFYEFNTVIIYGCRWSKKTLWLGKVTFGSIKIISKHINFELLPHRVHARSLAARRGRLLKSI